VIAILPGSVLQLGSNLLRAPETIHISPNMPLSSYLASRYLTAEPSSNSSKKRKRKVLNASPSNGLVITDDDALGWSKTPVGENSDEDIPTFATGSAEFRKSKKSNWKVVGVPAPKVTDIDLAAEAIIASTAAENAAASHQDEEPTIERRPEGESIVKMGDGTHAGLQSAAAVEAQLENRRAEERAAWGAGEAGKKGRKAAPEETVYRDATGRRIDISMRRAEARAEAEQKSREEREAAEAQAGDVQRAAKVAQREALEEAKYMPFARSVDDEEMNAELKSRQRWNDPAALFLKAEEKGKSVTGKELYKGAAQPNRYGIRPGYRWDGVDRSNGWEAERFRALNRKERNKQLDFAWQMDV
jgi:pre-mRNA-splicing factor CWC26